MPINIKGESSGYLCENSTPLSEFQLFAINDQMNRLAVDRSARAQQAHKVDNRIDRLHKVENRIDRLMALHKLALKSVH